VYGSCLGEVASCSGEESYDALADTVLHPGMPRLSFDPVQIIDNLRFERYADSGHRGRIKTALDNAYYSVRPLLHLSIRKQIQKAYLNNWRKLAFPRWPVDCTVDRVLATLLLLSLKTHAVERVPFIWFWPEGASSCTIMTHDVETAAGRDYCSTLMDIDDAFGIKASFQVVPEKRYSMSDAFLDSLRERGFEINIQDLNHDGHLFRSREEFLTRAASINAHGRRLGVSGFRSAVLYRQQEWYNALEFSYDMSVPNVAHLDPQRGGCCTVMPYFVGNILELPVTTTQDYTLFHILNDYTLDLWNRQMQLITERNGLISFIVHPDYIREPRARRTYEALLSQLNVFRDSGSTWVAKPGEVNSWWRQRMQMRLVEDGKNLRIEGAGCERARIAFAYERAGQLAFQLEDNRTKMSVPQYA
jgi:hypothetical protein